MTITVFDREPKKKLGHKLAKFPFSVLMNNGQKSRNNNSFREKSLWIFVESENIRNLTSRRPFFCHHCSFAEKNQFRFFASNYFIATLIFLHTFFSNKIFLFISCLRLFGKWLCRKFFFRLSVSAEGRTAEKVGKNLLRFPFSLAVVIKQLEWVFERGMRYSFESSNQL